MIANDKEANEQIEKDQENQESGSGQPDKRIQQTKEAKIREWSI
jgi:hypothetical protein